MMSRYSVLASACVIGVLAVSAQAVMFDFNGLSNYQGSGAVANYMSATYGSQITVNNTRVGAGSTYGVNFGPDSYLFTDLGTFFCGPMEMKFRSNAIGSMSFQGCVFRESANEDFVLKAYAGNQLVGQYAWNGVGSFNSGNIVFDKPVDRLLFSDSFVHDVGIDDLSVNGWGETLNAVPVPASLVLGGLGIGVIGLVRRARKA